MEAQTVKELHQHAKVLGLTGHWEMNKPELILFLRKSKGKGVRRRPAKRRPRPVPAKRRPRPAKRRPAPSYTPGTFRPVAPKRIGSVLPDYENIKDDIPPKYSYIHGVSPVGTRSWL